ncbi:MAG TPA: hypothetical protein PLD88_06770 [Candidatus Berkiella sp.]|nr:hypothetical protein [Candidatus Berkiella sp.]
MKKLSKVSFATLVLATGWWGFVASADNHNPLPPAALEACSDKQSGDICSFVNEKGDSINGACSYQGNVDGKLYCVPIH